MWADILLYNREPVRQALERTQLEAAELCRLLDGGDLAALRRYLETGRQFRQGIER